ncbi:MAG TPA: cupin domain-containing protein [Anaerolineales bacterium]|nr:cupin domain-containing protein [Anaerolineales bacterium]
MSDEPFFLAEVETILPPIPQDSIVSRAFYTGDGVRATLFGFAAGQELTEHTASQAAILHFLKGHARLVLGELRTEAGPGSWAHMPAHLPHSVHAEDEMVMLLLLLD